MAGKIIGGLIVLTAAIVGVSIYYLQVYAFYDRITDAGPDAVQLTSLVTGEPETILFDDFRAIDSASSPIRYRACFRTGMSLALLTETYESYPDSAPRMAPGWFDCFDAEALGHEIETGIALPFLGVKNIAYGVDRVVAITADGRGYVWHELNDCGEKAYDGSLVGEECPPRE